MLDLLTSIRVLDASSIVMGPLAGQILGDLGAEVIKLEPPSGDLARSSGTRGPDGTGALFANTNRNKRGLCLDLKTAEGRAALSDLLDGCDVVIHNMRPAAAARIGLDPDATRRGRPRLIHCMATGYGTGGPNAGQPAYDDIIQAAGGMAMLAAAAAGPEGGAPRYAPTLLADKVGALHVVYAVLAALVARARTGLGQAIEVPMFETLAAFLMAEHLDEATFEADGAPGYRRLLNPDRRPYATADGWLAVMPYDERHWRAILSEIGATDLLSATWFPDPAERNRRSDQLYHRLATALVGRDTEAWIAVCARADIPCARLASPGDLLHDPHLAAQDFFAPTDGAPGRVRSVPMPVRFANATMRPDLPPPALGADTDRILSALRRPGDRDEGGDGNGPVR